MIARFLFISVALGFGFAQAQNSSQIKLEEEKMREVMVVMSRQLGVTCTACHNTDDFKSDKIAAFKIAKEHMKITQLLIDNGMNGKSGPKADCYMCHRGELRPPYQEKVPPMLKK